MSQTLGLSRLYDHVLKNTYALSEAETARMKKAARLERTFHRVALVGIAIRAVVWGSAIYGASEVWNQAATFGRIIIGVGTVGLITTHFQRPHWRQSNQWLFSLRRLWEIIPSFFNPAYIAFQRLNHGFEYLAVTASIERNSKRSRSRAIAVALLLGLVLIRAFVYVHQVFERNGPTPLDSWAFTGELANVTTILALTSLSISLMHYYYDSQIFRFSKPEFRDNVLPLIAPNHDAKSAHWVGSRSSKP